MERNILNFIHRGLSSPINRVRNRGEAKVSSMTSEKTIQPRLNINAETSFSSVMEKQDLQLAQRLLKPPHTPRIEF